MIFCSWVTSYLRPATGRGAVPASGENRAPPSGSASETNNECQNKFELIQIIDWLTGKTRLASFFVTVLGTSDFTGACPRAG
jgi:hypothetical protein